MSNNEKDNFIRKTLQSDRIMAGGDEIGEKVKKDLDISKIKLKKYTFGERRFMRFLCLVLFVSVASNIYLLNNKRNNVYITSNEYPADIVTIKDDIIEDNNIEQENVVAMENTTNEDAINNIENTEVVVSENIVAEPVDNTKIDEELLKDELTRYALTIGRFDDDNDALEKNTILLLIANGYFNTKVSQNTGLEISSSNEYAMTVNNVNLFIEELTGNKVNTFLNSYANYIKYNEASKSYASGTKSASLNTEQYELSNLQVSPSSNADEYIIKGNINRKSQAEVTENKKTVIKDMDANYDLEAVISLNNNYSYVPYLIKSYKAVLKEGEEDIVIRLADLEAKTTQK
jgi:hypothetical protein